VTVPHADTTLLVLPTGCSPDAGLLIGDNLATAWIAVERGRLQPGECVTVVGGGAVGQLTALCAQAVAAGAVVVVEPNPDRRRFAEAYGALVSTPEEAPGFVRDLTGGDGADLVVDAVGGNAALDAAVALVRRRGRVVSVGMHAADAWPMPVAAAFGDEISLAFAIGNSIPVRRQLATMIAAGAIDPTVVIDARVSLEGVPAAYETLRAQGSLKTVVEVAPLL
jgi:threonine dehydrogenase-like Zn-dependent dehydrogenase